MVRPTNTEQRRSEIVNAFLKVMAEEGYAKATIQAIAKEAGLRSGLIHYHFKHKQEILIELVKQVSASAQARYESLLIDATTPQEKIKAFIDARLAKGDSADPQTVAAWVVIGTEAIRQQEVRVEYEKVIGMQQELLEKLIASTYASKRVTPSIKKIAAIVLAAIEGAFQLSVAAQNVMPSGYAAESLFNLLNTYLESKD
jgi:TetR/AcrR family transcriptional repressor of bet genes